MPDLVYNVKFNIQSPQAGSGITQISQQAQAVGQDFAKSTVLVDVFGNTVETAGSRASESMGRIVNSTNLLKTSQQQLVGQTQRMNSSFSSTNQVLFSFSDGIQDASQFSYGFATGMRAVGNNIGFTAELFANLKNRVTEYNVANQAAIASGKVMAKTMGSEIWGALKGPGGIILALNLAITAVTMFSRAQEVAKKKTEEAKGSINDYARALKQLRDIADPAESQRQQLEADVRNLQIAISLVKQIEEEQKKLKETTSDLAATRNREKQSTLGATVAAKDNRAELKEQEKASQDLIDSLTRQVAQYTDIEPVLSKLNGAYNTAVETLKAYNNEVEVTSEIRLGAGIDTLRGQVANAVREYGVGISTSMHATDALSASVEQQIESIRREAVSNKELIPTLDELIKLREQLRSVMEPDFKAAQEARLLAAESVEDERDLAKALMDARLANLDEEFKMEMIRRSEYNNRKISIEREYQQTIAKIEQEEYDRKRRAAQEARTFESEDLELRLSQIEEERHVRAHGLRMALRMGLIDREEFGDQELELIKSYNDKVIQAEIDAVNKVRDATLENLREQFEDGKKDKDEYDNAVAEAERAHQLDIANIRSQARERDDKERRMIADLQLSAISKGRDTEAEINAFYDQKQLDEAQELRDQNITNEELYSALSLSIEAQRQNELTRLAEKGEDARREIQELTVEQQKDLYMRLVSSVSDATQAIFGQNKAVAIAEAIINTYLAASKAAVSYPFPFNRIAVAAEIASGLARVATIKNTKIGSTSAGGGEQQSSSFGFTETQIQGAQQFRTPGFVPTAPSSGQMMTPKVEILADRKQLYYIVKTGEEEYRNIKAS